MFSKISLQLTKFQLTVRAFLHANLTYEIIVTEWKKVHQLFLSSLPNAPMHFEKTKSLRIKGFKLLNSILWYKTTALLEVRQNSAIGIYQQQSTCKV